MKEYSVVFPWNFIVSWSFRYLRTLCYIPFHLPD